jgi:hypothetical protein
MTDWLLALVVGGAAAGLLYARTSAPSLGRRVALALLRVAAITLAMALLLDAPVSRATPPLPSVYVDGSLSMTRGASNLWATAWDSAGSVSADSIWVFGDSLSRGDEDDAPLAANTRLRPVVERSMVTGHPVVLITDGEVQDSSALDGLASGSRVVVLPRTAHRDVGVSTMDAPRAAVDGDSLSIRLTLAAAGAGAAAGSVSLLLDDELLGRWPIDTMSAWGERQLDLRARATGVQGARVLRAVVTSPGDVERRNDTLSATIEISRAASAVFVSTSPDQDARFAIAVLRGTLALPTRGFLRIAPGQWRQEGTLAPASEADVRQAMRDAPVVILHGDTAMFGPPRSVTFGPLALMVPSEADDGEWYPSGTPASALSGVLAAFPLESLPPISAGVPAQGDWIALETRRGREATRRPVVVGSDSPRRTVTVTGSGFWRWRFRGGASADAYAALWGGIFDWLAAERADRRGAVPDENVVRAGQPIRWRRGSSTDSTVRVAALRRGGPTRADTLVLRFTPGSAIQETAPLPPGTYDVTVPGGRTTLTVNASAELLPRRPRLQSGEVGGRAGSDQGRGARRMSALYALVIVLLCAEWIARRRAGLR